MFCSGIKPIKRGFCPAIVFAVVFLGDVDSWPHPARTNTQRQAVISRWVIIGNTIMVAVIRFLRNAIVFAVIRNTPWIYWMLGYI